MKNMAKTLLISFLAALSVPAASLAFAGTEAIESAQASPEPSPGPAAEVPAPKAAPEKLIQLLDGDKCVSVPLEEYIVGVVAAEMPASFEAEALKAQAVAARSYTLYRISSGVHGGCICSDPSCCEAWLSEEALREKWGGAFDTLYARIKDAVADTESLCLSFGGEAILAAFHSSSDAFTEDSENVFRAVVPYLRSVPSPEDEGEVPDFASSVHFTPEELSAALSLWDASASIPASDTAIITDVVRSDSGRIIRAKLCGRDVSGAELRNIFSLRSAKMSWETGADGGMDFFCTGYGHGVGMSQYGAKVMARQGADYAEILAHYYPGTELVPISALKYSRFSF